MRVRDLGALIVAVGTQEQPVVGTRGAAMLALLTINVNQRVSVDALMDAAWGDQVSAGAASTLASHVWRLRQLLEPGRDRGQAPSVLVNDSDGYRLVGGPSTVDSLLLGEAAVEVRDLLAAGHAQAAVRRADAALALWRGRPYGGFAEAEWAQSAVARLEELRGQLQERRVEGLLASGALDTAVSDLQPLIAAMPFRESLRALLMEALYRGGRAEEALHAYQEVRRTLLDEVGIEPGVGLQDLQQRILTNDPALDRRVDGPASPPRDVEVHLPAWLTPLVGRADILERLVALVRLQRLVTVTGAAGCGKTRGAVEAARAVADAFPDGVWFVDLTAVSDPDLVVDVVVSTIGFAASRGATPLQDLRRYLQSRRILLVLDNCEHVLPAVDQIVRVTLGDARVTLECAFLTTSREPIGIDGETIWTMDPLELPDEANTGDSTAAPAPAVELFLQRLAAVAPRLDVDDHVRARAKEICVAVDGLPLPIELAAARALSHSLDDIAAQVMADPSRLSRIGRGPRDHRATVRSAIEWSHQLLSPQEQQAHRRLSVLPGVFTADLANVVVGTVTDDEVSDVDDLLAQLVHRSLLSSEGSSGPGRPTRFRQLATVRSHAGHALADSGEARTCFDRRDAWTEALLDRRPPLGTLAEAAWYQAIDDDYAGIRATLARRLIDEPSPVGGRMAGRLFYYWYYREMLVEASRWLRLGHQVLLDADPVDLLVGKVGLAAALALQGRGDLAGPYRDDVLRLLPSLGSEQAVEIGEGLVGLTMAAVFSDQRELVVELDRRMGPIVDGAESTNLRLLGQAVRCHALFVRGMVVESVSLARSVQDDGLAAGNVLVRWWVSGPPIVAALVAGRPQDGIPWVERGIADHLRLGIGAIGMFLETRANFAAMQRDYATAAKWYAAGRSETLRAAMPWPRRPLTDQLLGSTRANLDAGEFERAWQEGERLTLAQIVGLTGRA